MRQSPRRPLILKRRKLPFHQNEPAETQSQSAGPDSKHPSQSASSQSFLEGVRVMGHPSMSDTQVVVIPKTANLQSVIGALTVKGKESGVHGPNKFILLNENSSQFNEASPQPPAEADRLSNRTADGLLVKTEPTHNAPDAQSLARKRPLTKDLNCGPLDDSLTNIQWLGKIDSSVLEADPAEYGYSKENLKPASVQAQKAGIGPEGVRPPYSYMAMIQFAINSRENKMMTLKEIYTWIEDHFPYYRDVAKPGWKNSIRHNLSLHDMFIRETSPDGKVSLWTIRPEANRCLTLDQVYKPGCDPMTTPVPVPILVFPQPQMRILSDVRKTPSCSERKIKPLLPRTDSYLVPIQLPVPASVFLPSSSSSSPAFHAPQQKRSTPREAKRVRIAPKVTQSSAPGVSLSPQRSIKVEVKDEPVEVRSIGGETPKAAPKTQTSRSRRKQRLVRSLHEEPVLLCPNNAFFDSGVVSDASMLQDVRDTERDENCPDNRQRLDENRQRLDENRQRLDENRQRLDENRQRLDENRQRLDSPDREYCFKTPIKSSGHLASSTPSKPSPSVVAEPWKVTPVRKGAQTVLDFSPIRTPGGLTLTPTLSFNSTPFKDWPLFNSPRELLTSASPKVTVGGGVSAPASPREPLQAPSASPSNRSVTEGLVLDTINDSLSKILVDISFTGLEDEELGMANISWSEFFPQLK